MNMYSKWTLVFLANLRYESADENDFDQAASFWNQVLNAEERARLVMNIANSLRLAKDFIQVCRLIRLEFIYSFRSVHSGSSPFFFVFRKER